MSQPSRSSQSDSTQLAPGTLYTLLAATGFAAVAILTSLALETGATLTTILAWRYTLSAVILIIWIVTHSYEKIPRFEVFRFITVGGIGQALLVFLALSSLKYISAATLAFLFYTYPTWVALVQGVRGAERIDGRRALALGLSFIGIAVMVGMPAEGVDWRGVALALAGAVVYGFYIPIMRVIQKDHPVAPPSAYSKIGAALVFLTLSLFDGSFTWQLTAPAWNAILALTVFSTVLPSVFFLMGLIRLGPVRTAIVSTVEPFLTAILGVFVLQQAFTVPTLIGGALIISAVVLLQVRRDRVA